MSEQPLDVTAIAVVSAAEPHSADRFASLAAQSLGAARYEVIAVVVGADGADAEFERFADKHPDVCRVLRVAEAAAARNAALEAAGGRYVCFLDAADRPGPDALEHLVAAADDADADVLLCGEPETPYAAHGLAAVRLVHVRLLDDLRFDETDPHGSFERFALRALAKAKNVAVAPGGFAEPQRPSATPLEWIAAARRLVADADELLAGEDREALVHRVFAREIAAALDPSALALDAFDRAESWRAAAEFADAHLTEPVRLALPTEARVRVSLAQHGDLELLEAALAQPAPRLLLEDGRLYARYPGFRRAGHDLPDAWFEVEGERVTDRLARGTEPRYLVWTGVKRADYRVEYSFALPVEGLAPEAIAVGAVPVPDGAEPEPRAAHPADAVPGFEVDARVDVAADGDTAVVTAGLLLADLLGRPLGRWSLRAAVTVGGTTYDLPLKAPNGYVRREGMLRGVSVQWGRDLAVMVRVRHRAVRRGVSRVLSLLSDKLRSGLASGQGRRNQTPTLSTGFSSRSLRTA